MPDGIPAQWSIPWNIFDIAKFLLPGTKNSELLLHFSDSGPERSANGDASANGVEIP
ncbi:MAG: hypothetical protein ACYCYR_04290 [Desulfobulbaceae bacterium]